MQLLNFGLPAMLQAWNSTLIQQRLRSKTHSSNLDTYVFFVVPLSPRPRFLKTGIQTSFLSALHALSWNQSNLEVPRDSNKSSFELIVIDIIRVWRLFFACDDAVAAKNTDECCIKESGSDNLSRARTRSGAEREMLDPLWNLFGSGRYGAIGVKPTFRVESSSWGTEMVNIYSRISNWIVKGGLDNRIPWLAAWALIKIMVLAGIFAPSQTTSCTVFLGRDIAETV